jgi:hypothetical protein
MLSAFLWAYVDFLSVLIIVDTTYRDIETQA